MKYGDIDYSQLEHAGKGCALERVTFNVGTQFNGGASFVRGNKDTPLYLSSSGHMYEEQLCSARGSLVLMYDVEERRAWLLDGASALLHLTRMQLESPPYNKKSQRNLANLKHARVEDGADAAWLALQDDANRALPLLTENVTEKVTISDESGFKEQTKTTTKEWCFQDLVQRTWNVLELLIDHQASLSTSQAVPLRLTDREKLEGFEFLDIVRRKSQMKARVAVLKSSGRGWVDFIRSIGAVCLLGRGFGDLIVPGAAETFSCLSWMRMPTGKDYLAVLVSTLRSICREHGSMNSNPVRLAHGVYWHQPQKALERCKCIPGSSRTCDLVQVLLPPSLGPKNRPDAINQLDGAVIFGKSRRLHFHWPNIGLPWARPATEGDSEDEVSYLDSGLGTSPGTSRSRSITDKDIPPSTSPPTSGRLPVSSFVEGKQDRSPSKADKNQADTTTKSSTSTRPYQPGSILLPDPDSDLYSDALASENGPSNSQPCPLAPPRVRQDLEFRHTSSSQVKCATPPSTQSHTRRRKAEEARNETKRQRTDRR